MHALKQSIAFLLMAAAVALTACQTSVPQSIKPTPPLVTDCLVTPSSQVTTPPTPPVTLTDDWAKGIWRWASDALGVITTDRKEWQGERRCVRGKAETGAIR
ncbi:hypothetical protein GCM10027432_24200 [Lysobacter fragariae]